MVTCIVLLLFSLTVFTAPAHSATIDFEGTGAPTLFTDTTALTDAFATSGAMFAGPDSNDGGAVLNDGTGVNFGIEARSGSDLLAFNAGTALSDGGVPRGPEIILFDAPVSSVSIWASGGFFDGMFQLEAFDNADLSLGMVQVATFADWELLSFTGPAIQKVQLTEMSGIQAFVFDDLSFEPSRADNEITETPEPGTLFLVGGALLGLAGLKRRQQRRARQSASAQGPNRAH